MTTKALAKITDKDLVQLGFSAAGREAALRRPLADLVEETLQAAGRSAHTRRAYVGAIGLFLQHLDAQRGDVLPKQWATAWRPFATAKQQGKAVTWSFTGPAAILRLVDAGTLDTFRAWRESAGDGPNTATQRVYAVKTFLNVAYRDNVLTSEQAQALGLKAYKQKQKRDVQPVGRRLTQAEARALRGVVDITTNKGKRDLAILDLGLFAGLRSDEIANLELGNFKQSGGRWWIVFAGKGSKTRRVKVADQLYKSLATWLGAAGLAMGGTGRVFRSVNKGDAIGNAMPGAVIGRIVAEYGALAGLAPAAGGDRLSPHDLRRSCARNAYDNGASLLQVQALLGHADPKTTALYIGAYDQDDNRAEDFVKWPGLEETK